MASTSHWYAVLLFLGFAALVERLFSTIEPYMDEVFHIPQAQAYCQGGFDVWDPKITTFPGLYLAAFVFLAFPIWLLRAAGVELDYELCSTRALRSLNIIFGVGTLLVMHRIIRRQEPNNAKAAAWALTLSLSPTTWFFLFLFYTDVGGTFFILLAFDLSTPREPHERPTPGRFAAAALACSLSILFRQTNAVWVMFIFGVSCLRDLEGSLRWGPRLSAAPADSAAGPFVVAQLVCLARGLVSDAPRLLFSRGLALLLLPPLGFAYFVAVLNGGFIVVGDHENHSPERPHFAMVMGCSWEVYEGARTNLPLAPTTLIFMLGLLSLFNNGVATRHRFVVRSLGFGNREGPRCCD
mmetsp:Transcript_3443/g.7993  ORF Transcript_3443/g.7993 Transcript_3443/m.7993 type:complete len:353 (+) Transcript_3443:63-1121(+)